MIKKEFKETFAEEAKEIPQLAGPEEKGEEKKKISKPIKKLKSVKFNRKRKSKEE